MQSSAQNMIRGHGVKVRAQRSVAVCATDSSENNKSISRRNLASIGLTAGLASQASSPQPAQARKIEFKENIICDAECAAALEDIPTQTTANGLKYKDIRVGKGPMPERGFQVVVNYVAMNSKGQIFENSPSRGQPFDLRVGTGYLLPGLDEAILTMRPGGLRRAYVPPELSFQKDLKQAAGRPRIPARDPLTLDIEFLYTPGLEEIGEDADILELQ